IDQHEESSGADIRMGPERNDAWSNFLVLDDGKGRAIVGFGRQQGSEHNRKPSRYSPDRTYFHVRTLRQGPQNQDQVETRRARAPALHEHYPLIRVARISMGWNTSHVDAIHKMRQTAAQGTKARSGLAGESSSARPCVTTSDPANPSMRNPISMTCTMFDGSPVRVQRGAPKIGHPRCASALCVTGITVYSPVRK